jgi:hypothetical protein
MWGMLQLASACPEFGSRCAENQARIIENKGVTGKFLAHFAPERTS